MQSAFPIFTTGCAPLSPTWNGLPFRAEPWECRATGNPAFMQWMGAKGRMPFPSPSGAVRTGANSPKNPVTMAFRHG